MSDIGFTAHQHNKAISRRSKGGRGSEGVYGGDFEGHRAVKCNLGCFEEGN